MAITMQGSWTVSVKTRNAAFAQRFVISGASTGNGVHAGNPGTSVFVTGAQWSINIQSQAPAQPWRDSRQRILFPSVSGGVMRFDITSDDTGADLDFNDLVLTCSAPVSASEFVVYGSAKTYFGICWNPCYRWYYAIETEEALAAALQNANLRRIIEKLYPERVPRKPVPGPDPAARFRPLLLPTGAPVENTGLVFHSSAAQAAVPLKEMQGEELRRFEESTAARLKGTARPVTFDGAPVTAGAALLTREDQLVLARLSDRYTLFPRCTSSAAPGLLLQFQEYDRTAAEKLGGSYTGTGTRENLGLASTDELGNYIFRFSRSLSDFADETLDAGPGETLSTQIFPDLIVQVLGSGFAVDFETPPHYNVPNLVRIDLCIPFGAVHPSSGSCTGFDRVINRIGDILVLHSALGGHPNTLDADGRITASNAGGPVVSCAAWRNIFTGGRVGLSVYACFGEASVATYTMRYKRRGVDPDWQFVSEPFKLNHIPDFAVGYTGTPVGSTLRSVRVDGGAPVLRPTYDNHQGDSNWIENDLKLILNTALYCDASNHGSVDFAIQGYDSAGNHVAGTDDVITLYLDNNPSTGLIRNINVGAAAPDDCALLSLPAPDAPLTVQYTVDNPDGFLNSWSLSVTRGNNYSLPVAAGGVIPQSFPASGLADVCAFHGSQDYALDGEGFSETTLQPGPHVDPLIDDPSGLSRTTWLPIDKNFCAFAFTLTATDRVTDGRSKYPETVFYQDLVGISIP